jgi:hypothetical protein
MAGRLKVIVDKVVEKLTERAFDAVVAVPIVTTAWLALTGALRAFLTRPITLQGWQLAALASALVVLSVVVGVFWWRSRVQDKLARAKPKPFTPIRVDDPRLNLFWMIKKPPREWVENPALDNAAESYLVRVLDGPFHGDPRCGERLSVQHRAYSLPDRLYERCQGCGTQLFTDHPADDQEAYRVRLLALRELCRLHRVGVPIEGPSVVLQQPLYWNILLPPPGGAPTGIDG